MSKVCLLTDTHFGARSDQVAFLQHMHWFFQHVFFPTLQENNIKIIYHLGDLVDRRKYINYNTLQRMKTDFLQEIVERNLEMHIIPGNHDTFYKNTLSLNALNEIVSGYKGIHVHNKIEVIQPNLVLVPWITEDNRQETEHVLSKASEESIVMGHLELAGFSMNPGTVAEHGEPPETYKKFRHVYSGHYHSKSTKGNVTYLGAPFQFNWGDYGDLRGFHLLDTETLDLEFIENPYSMFSQVVYDENDPKGIKEILAQELMQRYVKVIVRNKKTQAKFENFIKKIDEKMPLDLKIVETMQLNIDKENFSGEETTTEIIRKYVDQVDSPVKSKLESKMLSLYERAIVSE